MRAQTPGPRRDTTLGPKWWLLGGFDPRQRGSGVPCSGASQGSPSSGPRLAPLALVPSITTRQQGQAQAGPDSLPAPRRPARAPVSAAHLCGPSLWPNSAARLGGPGHRGMRGRPIRGTTSTRPSESLAHPCRQLWGGAMRPRGLHAAQRPWKLGSGSPGTDSSLPHPPRLGGDLEAEGPPPRNGGPRPGCTRHGEWLLLGPQPEEWKPEGGRRASKDPQLHADRPIR